MGQKRPLIFLAIAMGIALVTTVMVYRWLQGQRMIEVNTPEVVLEGVSVAVASADIPWGTPLADKAITNPIAATAAAILLITLEKNM